MKNIKGAFCLISILFLLTSCIGWLIEQPTITVRSITLSAVSLTGAQLVLGVEVYNPNRYDLELQSLEFEFQLKDQSAGQGNLQKTVLVQKKTTSSVSIPISVNYSNIADCIKDVIANRDIPYALTGHARIKVGFGSTDIPLSKRGLINLRNALKDRS